MNRMSTEQQQLGGIVYLACPYTHSDPDVRKERFDKATVAAAYLISRGQVVYSPITMTHPIDVVMAKEAGTLGSEFWVRFDEAFMATCSRIVVLRIPGWDLSNGVRREIRWFEDAGQPVEYLDWSDVEPSSV